MNKTLNLASFITNLQL